VLLVVWGMGRGCFLRGGGFLVGFGSRRLGWVLGSLSIS